MKTFIAALLAVPLLLLAGTASAAPDVPGNANARFLVGFDRAPGASERAALARAGAEVTAEFGDVAAVAVTVSERGASALARQRGVSYVEPDEWREPLGLADAQLTPALDNGLYGLLTTRATAVHARGWSGQGVKACVADTGLDAGHPDIAANFVEGRNFVSGQPTTYVRGAADETHGTHVAGTVLGASNGVGVYGVAYSASLYHARVLRNDGGYSSDIMNGVKWLVEQKGCRVVNMSLGGSRSSKTEENFYKSMRSKGALIVAATGNDSASRIGFPAGYATNIAVGAVDRTNAIASFSNRGKNIDVVAPGVTVLSSVPSGLGSESSVAAGGATRIAYGLEYAGRTNGTSGTLVDCGLAKAPADCAKGTATSFVALVQRGDISFADKVTNAKAAGAAAVVIYNNAPSEFTGTLGAAGNWIPAVSVSGTDGAALKASLGTTATVVSVSSAWDHFEGTSMATPHVSGVVAQLWSAKPGLSNAAIEDALFRSATNLGAAGYDTTYGHGLVNAEAALDRIGG